MGKEKEKKEEKERKGEEKERERKKGEVKNSHFSEIEKYFQLTSKSRTLLNAKLNFEAFFFHSHLIFCHCWSDQAFQFTQNDWLG